MSSRPASVSSNNTARSPPPTTAGADPSIDGKSKKSASGPTFAFVSGFSLDPDTRALMKADAGIALSNQSDHPDLLAYLESTGAREVAVTRGFCESFAEELRRRGLEAYALGPPRQMELFRG